MGEGLKKAGGKIEHARQNINTQIELLEIKIALSKMKNMLHVINSRIGIAEEKNSEFEVIAIETIQKEAQREWRIQRNKGASVTDKSAMKTE